MSLIRDVSRLSPDAQFEAYKRQAAHFRSMAQLSLNEGAKLTFLEMAREMDAQADSVIVFAPR